MEDTIRKLSPRFKIRSPRPIHARRPALKFAAHLLLRGHSAIKLATGNNPSTTTSIFDRATNTLVAGGMRSVPQKLLSYRFIRRLAYFISLGTNCFERIPYPLGVVTAARRRRATAQGEAMKKLPTLSFWGAIFLLIVAPLAAQNTVDVLNSGPQPPNTAGCAVNPQC